MPYKWGEPVFETYENDFFSYLELELSLKQSTISRHKVSWRRLKTFFGSKPLTVENVRFFIREEKERGVTNGTIVVYVNTLRVFVTYLSVIGKPIEDPLEKITMPKVKSKIPDTLTCEEIQSIIDEDRGVRRKAIVWTYKNLFTLLAITGCRIGEALNIKWQDVSFPTDSILFRETKNDEPRAVPISPALTKELKRNEGNPEDLVFKSYRGNALTQNNVRDELVKRAKKVGIKKHVHPHIFRHSFATQMLQNGHNVMVVAKILGHRNLATTQRYSHLVLQDMRKIQNTHPLLASKESIGDTFTRIRDMVEESVKNDKRIKTRVEMSDRVLKLVLKHYK